MRVQRSLLVAIVSLTFVPGWAAASHASAGAPLIAGESSHVVVMEYEAWFGPNAVNFQSAAAQPELQSSDMGTLGGGYDSADPAVIRQHAAWLEYAGVDAALIDLTNNVSCIFDSVSFARQNIPGCDDAFRSGNQSIRDNTGNLYPAWSRIGTSLKLIPMLGGVDPDILLPDTDGKTAFEKEIAYFGALMSQYRNLNVMYEGKPLMIIFIGAGQDPESSDNPMWLQLRMFLKNHPEIASKYTFREMAGFLDSQPGLWAKAGTPSGPIEINPRYGFWSFVDRLNPSCKPLAGYPCPYFPTYNRIPAASATAPQRLAWRRVENFTVSIATAGQTGWGCPDPNSLPYCFDDSLRFDSNQSYATFDAFMAVARRLDPVFLFIHQFNEFVPPDEGFDANTENDVEPSNLWGHTALDAVRTQIEMYRNSAPAR